jgi:diketogulonate reductase-like aldo/keto reductase
MPNMAPVSSIPALELNNGVSIPRLGFGTWNVGGREVEMALDVGYRSLDTATIYGNEDGVGRAIASSGIPRDEIFVTTKVWEDDQGFDSTLRAFEASRSRLGLDFVDLYLIHWPAPQLDLYVETWRAMERLLAEGAVRAIGVSNFHVEHLERLARETDTVPALNQIELNPHLPRTERREYHAEHGIATEAWAPLARAGELLREPVVRELADRHGRTPAQIVLRWSIQLGNVVIPRSSSRARIEENFDVFGFELDGEDVARLTALGGP